MSYLSTSDLVTLIWKGKRIVFAIMVVSLVLALTLEKIKGERWSTTLTLIVSPASEKTTADFNYDHYYSLEAIDTLTDSLEEWTKSQAVKNQVKSEAKAEFRSADWRFFEKNNWSARKKAPQMVEVLFVTSSKENALKIEKSLKNKVSSFLTSFNRMGDPRFDLTNSSSDVEFQAPSFLIVIPLSLLWGFIFGTILVLLLGKEEKRKE